MNDQNNMQNQEQQARMICETILMETVNTDGVADVIAAIEKAE